MTLHQDTIKERQARLDKMIDEFRDAQKRALLRRGVALWNRTEVAQPMVPAAPPTPPDTVN